MCPFFWAILMASSPARFPMLSLPWSNRRQWYPQEIRVEAGIQPIGFSPLGSPDRPERDRTPEDTSPTEDHVISRIAQRHEVHPAVICIKWAVQRGQVPIPFSTNEHHILANLKCILDDPLAEQEMTDMARVDRNCRLIKGQVFLWKENQSWEDLWDLNGEITPP